MFLIAFDIDGTLTETNDVDDHCFVQSLEEVFRFVDVATDWSQYAHATDSGILQELFQSRLGRSPHADETAQFKDTFVAHLTAAASASPFRPIAGAPELLRRLRASSRHCVSLATGGWQASARLKMTSAGMRFDDFPSATADDAVSREAILRYSMERARVALGATAISSTVYIGDGVWDARTCRNLGIPFVGVATSKSADRLIAEGARLVLPDFSDLESCIAQLDAIAVENGRSA